MTVKIYTGSNCQQCIMTKKLFKMRGVEFEELQASDHIEYLKEELGYSTLPVVVTSSENWSGFRPDKIRKTN